jgi:hypothetical protein
MVDGPHLGVGTSRPAAARHDEPGTVTAMHPTVDDIDELIACSRVRWIADDLTAGAAGRVPVRHDTGFDLVDVAGTAAWWVPAEHAAKLRHGGVHLELSAPGARWLADVPAELTGRTVWAGRLADIATAPTAGFAKPAEAKLERLPARWWGDTGEFAAAASAAGMDGSSWVQISDRYLDLVEEHRCYVLDSTVLTTSPYLVANGDTYEPGWEHDPRFAHRDAGRFARHVVAELGEDQPVAYTLDVALCADGTWVVVEANPAWCSGFYGCDLTQVVDTIIAASVGEHGRWTWTPEPAFVTAAQRRPLRRWIPANERLTHGA